MFIKTLGPKDVAEGCYTMGVAGELVTDSSAGTAIVDDMSGQRVIVTSARRLDREKRGPEVEIINRKGQFAYRTGTHVSLLGGFSYVDGSFIVCGLELIGP